MVSQRLFESLPPFPDISTADIPKFSLSRPSSGDSAYTHTIFETCRTTGFFLLEMGGEETHDKIVKKIDAMFDLSNNFFDLETEQKVKYARDASNGTLTGCVNSPLLNKELVISINQRIAKGGERGRNPDSSLHGRMLVEQRPTAAQRTAASSPPLPTITSSGTCLLSRTLTPSNPHRSTIFVVPAPRPRQHRPYLVHSRRRARTTAWGFWHHQSVSQSRTHLGRLCCARFRHAPHPLSDRRSSLLRLTDRHGRHRPPRRHTTRWASTS